MTVTTMSYLGIEKRLTELEAHTIKLAELMERMADVQTKLFKTLLDLTEKLAETTKQEAKPWQMDDPEQWR
jgi:uncharacterized membrane-anchored protein YhcB (DUF1043 family)